MAFRRPTPSPRPPHGYSPPAALIRPDKPVPHPHPGAYKKSPTNVGQRALMTLCDDSSLHVAARTTRLVNHHAQLLGHLTCVLQVFEFRDMAIVIKNRQLASGEW